MLARALLIWLLIVVAEFIHGVARSVLLEPYVGDFQARQIAVFTGAVIILGIALLTVRWLRAERVRQLLGIGLLWLLLMLGFEIAFGRLVLGYSWARILADYNVFEGGLLPIGMLMLFLAPLLAAGIRRLI